MESEVASVLQRQEEKAAWNHRALTPAQRERLHATKERAEAMNMSVQEMLIIFTGDMEKAMSEIRLLTADLVETKHQLGQSDLKVQCLWQGAGTSTVAEQRLCKLETQLLAAQEQAQAARAEAHEVANLLKKEQKCVA